MFDIGFLEILVIFVLGLFVVGPDRLPGTIKTCAIWFSRFKRSIQEARAEFEQQIGADEIRREIHNQQILDSMRDLGDARKSFEDKVNTMKDDLLANEESQNAAGADESSENKTIPPMIDNEGQHENAETVSRAADEPHEPMIHDDSGEDASALPGRSNNTKKPVENQSEIVTEETPENKTATPTETSDLNGKQ